MTILDFMTKILILWRMNETFPVILLQVCTAIQKSPTHSATLLVRHTLLFEVDEGDNYELMLTQFFH